MWRCGATGLLNNHALISHCHCLDHCVCPLGISREERLMDPVIVIAALIILAVEVYIRLL